MNHEACENAEQCSLTCGLVEVTLEVDRSMTEPPGDVGSADFSCAWAWTWACAWAAATHFTDRFIADGKPGGIPPVVGS